MTTLGDFLEYLSEEADNAMDLSRDSPDMKRALYVTVEGRPVPVESVTVDLDGDIVLEIGR